jgi:FlaG/FlaF family flagellin (archaellin)
MSVTLTINNTPFEYPEPGDQAPWGSGATDWSIEVTRVLNSLSGPSDILETTAIIDNNQTTPQPIGGFFFDPVSVRSFSVQVSIYRVYGTNEIAEQLTFNGLNLGASGWQIQADGIGNAGVTLDITNLGQVTYTSSNLTGSPYSGIIRFRGIGILSA